MEDLERNCSKRPMETPGKRKFTSRCQHSLPLLKPFRTTKRHQHPIDNAGLFSFTTLNWITPLARKAYKMTELKMNDLWGLPSQESSELNCQRLQKLWEDELRKRGKEKVSLSLVIWRFCQTRSLLALFSLIITLIASFIGPAIFIRALLEYAESKESHLVRGLLLVFGIFGTEFIRSWSFALNWAMNYRTGIRLKGAVLSMAFEKILKLKESKDVTTGELVNMCSNDGHRLFEVVAIGCVLAAGPLVAVLGLIYTAVFLGPTTLIGSAVFILFYPFMMLAAKMTAYFRRQCIAVTDRRVRIMNEILNCIRFIKMYTWENTFIWNIQAIRNAEKAYLEKAGYVQSVTSGVGPAVVVVASVCTFSVHMALGYDLSAPEAFTVVTVFNSMSSALKIIPLGIKAASEASVSIARFQRLLLMEEIEICSNQSEISGDVVEFKGAFLSWKPGKSSKTSCENNKSDGHKHMSEPKEFPNQENPHFPNTIGLTEPLCDNHVEYPVFEQPPVLLNVNFTLKKGKLIGICGSVGSGKSSLLLSILGQMTLLKGTVSVAGNIAYVAQQAWIFNASLRENILFGQEYDGEIYKKTLEACSLNPDIKALPAGDLTEIGERGVNLSGGQRQRISLARALYSDRSLVLLDDPLSAVDVYVADELFKAIKTGMQNRSVLFVTHQLQYLSECDEILFMKNGYIAEQGTHQELMEMKGDYAALFQSMQDGNIINSKVKQFLKNQDVRVRNLSFTHPVEITDGGKNEGLTMEAGNNEDNKEVILGGDHTESNVHSAENDGQENTSAIINNSTLPSSSMRDNPQLHFYIHIYVFSMVAALLLRFIRGYVFVKSTIKASTRLHDQLFHKILSSPIRLFDTTPIGRILNRFTKDLDEVDTRLPSQIEQLLQNLIHVMFCLGIISSVFPWFLLSVIPLSILFYTINKAAKILIRELKRLDNISHSPFISHVTSTLHGITTIQAYCKGNDSIHKFQKLLDTNHVPFFLFTCATRWLAVRLDLISITIITLTALCIVLMHGHIPPAYAGLAISYAVQLTGLFQFTVRLATETEARFTSVERINYYIENLDSETPSHRHETSPPSNWPQQGKIRFENVKMRYRENLPLVLKNISFSVEPREKIGIVGRTGSGKSSLCMTLFRLVELEEGLITIDDICISKIGLHNLRKKLSIIPQEPVLFVGSVRSNLDPTSQHTDEEIWKALERTHMRGQVEKMETQLFAEVTENGSNFSVGERQLLCMARALLRNSKILLLDEATAAIDNETDALIQKTIEDAFSDCTVLIIAHRLNTVFHCDKILVMDHGVILEYDKPSVLLSNEKSVFHSMMTAAEYQNFSSTVLK
uniref:ATP-binding cassette sub-family C member 5 n=1 Tax=Leptobrachium leishanense TaxID=445787 RepID=A0A8C5LQJ0_9ANUR